MNLIDTKFIKTPFRFIFQCFLAGLSLFGILLFLNQLKHPAIIASLGATSFIVFTRPKWYSSDPRRLFGGYIVGISIGVFFFYLGKTSNIGQLLDKYELCTAAFGGISVAVSIFIMAITNTEHPPASGITLGLIIGEWNYHTIIFILLSLVAMYFTKKLFLRFLTDLI